MSTSTLEHTGVLIAGGGIAGLSVASELHAAGVDFHLVESRARFGGRIYSPTLEVGGARAAFDLGPSWFWPGQPRMATLARRLGATVFEQRDEGELVFEDERGRLQRGSFSPMAGSLRIDRGMGQLIEGLVEGLPPDRLHLDHRVREVEQGPPLVVQLDAEGAAKSVVCDSLVLALPPRVASTLAYSPALDARVVEAMNGVPTWMAGHAKVLAVYERAFWRDDGLSGDAMSRRGPLVEIHDASPREGGPFALFGFVGWAPEQRANDAEGLLEAVREQLARLFSAEAAAPACLHSQDWTVERDTATPLDRRPLHTHPDYGTPAEMRHVWDGKLLFASSEMASEFGGYLEGALGAAESVARVLVDR